MSEYMTPEQISQERASIAAERAALEADRAKYAVNGSAVISEIPLPAIETSLPDESDEDGDGVPPEWPHTTMDFFGETMEVRKPSSQALIAVSLASMGSLDQSTQVRVFSTFMAKHLSEASFQQFLIRLTDSDCEFGIQDLVTALARME